MDLIECPWRSFLMKVAGCFVIGLAEMARLSALIIALIAYSWFCLLLKIKCSGFNFSRYIVMLFRRAWV